MKIPYRKRAILKREKIVNYLLSLTHPQGRPKAIYFRSKGFDETNVNIFEELLLGVAYEREVIEVIESIHGKKYIINGEIKALMVK